MTETEAVAKASGIMDSLESARRYAEVWRRAPTIVMITAIAILVSLLEYTAIEIYDYYSMNLYLGTIRIAQGSYIDGTVPVFFTILAALLIVRRIITRTLCTAVTGEWKEHLKEGILGVLRMIETIDWEETFTEVSRAKYAFSLVTLLGIMEYWFISFILVFFIIQGISVPLLHFIPSFALLLLSSLLIAIALRGRTIGLEVQKIRNIDNFLWELRWLYTEYRQNGLQT